MVPIMFARPSPLAVRRVAIVALAANVGIVATGGLVRLTGSGLGCPDWPSCTRDSLAPTPALGWHADVEFGNRMLTYVVAVASLLLLVVAWRARPVRRSVRRGALAVFAGIPAQAVLGGISVLTDLNPWVVGTHFTLSMLIVGVCAWLVVRVGEPDTPAVPTVPELVRGMALGVLAVTAAVLWLGTVVTGSGPHAGDPSAARTGLDPRTITQLHADAVMLLVGLTIGLAVLARATAPAKGPAVGVFRAAVVMLTVEAAQGVIGYTQYFTHLPEALVEAHLIGAAALVVAAVRVVLACRARPAAEPLIQEAEADAAAAAFRSALRAAL